MATMNISLPDEMKSKIDTWVADGLYANASEFMRQLVREHDDKAKRLEAMLQEGLDSPMDPEPFDGEAFLAEIKAEFDAGD